MHNNRLLRQEGLVNQRKIEEQKVQIIGFSPIAEPLLLIFALLNLGIGKGSLNLYLDSQNSSFDGIFLSKGEKIIETLNDKVTKYNNDFFIQDRNIENPDITIVLTQVSNIQIKNGVFCQRSVDGFYIGEKTLTVTNYLDNVLNTGLNFLTASVLSQVILERCKCIRSTKILDYSLQFNLMLKSNLVSQHFSKEYNNENSLIQAKLLGQEVPLNPIKKLKENEGIFSLNIPGEMAKIIFDGIDVWQERHNKTNDIFFSLFGKSKIEGNTLISEKVAIPNKINSLNTSIIGIGALGNWLSYILALTKIDNLQFNICDYDNTVELHNLNRQILFSESDIGLPKVFVAENSLKSINKTVNTKIFPIEIKDDFFEYFKEGTKYLDYKHPSLIKSTGNTSSDTLLKLMCAKELINTDIIVSCLDNMKSRWLVNQLAQKLNKVFINGGTQEFDVSVDYIDSCSASLEKRYGSSIKEDEIKHSCTGTIPTLSISTSSAICGSLQTILCLLVGLKIQPPKNLYRFGEEYSTIYSTRL